MSSTENEALDIQGQGRKRYYRRDYTAAIAEYTKALKLHNVPSTVRIGILADRVHAREMMGGTVNLELALQDARAMIQLSKVDAAGYLHTGKLLQLLNRGKSALDIYADGVRQSKPDSPQFEALYKVFKKVQEVELGEVRGTRCDPLKYLPTELAESILQYLPFGDLMIVQRVSKAWRSFIHASRETYACLDFSVARRGVPKSSLGAYIRRSGGNVRGAALCWFNDGSALSTLVHQCPQLSILRTGRCYVAPGRYEIPPDAFLKDIRIARNLTVLITHFRFFLCEFCGILEDCASLRTFECSGITWASPMEAFTADLRRLKIWGKFVTYGPPEEELSDLMKCLPKLEKVEIKGLFVSSTVDFRSLESLSVLIIQWPRATAFPLLPESIRVLDISGGSKIRWSLQDLAASPLPNLETFNADYNPRIENAHVLAVLTPSLEKRSFRSLSLRMCPKVDFDSLEWLMTHGEDLEELAIGFNSAITDEMLKEVAKFKRLKYLDLSFSDISDIGLVNAVNGSQGVLRDVDISGCMNIGLGAVESAGKYGVRVTQRNERKAGISMFGTPIVMSVPF